MQSVSNLNDEREDGLADDVVIHRVDVYRFGGAGIAENQGFCCSPFLLQPSKAVGCFQFFSVTTVHLLGRSDILLDLLPHDRGFRPSAEKRNLMLLNVMKQLSNRLDVFNTPAFVLAEVDRDVCSLMSKNSSTTTGTLNTIPSNTSLRPIFRFRNIAAPPHE